MSKVIDLLNQAKTKLKASSNYQLAKLTGISEQDVSLFYKGTKRPSEEVIARLALVLERPIGELLATIRAEDAKTEKSRSFWRDFLLATKGSAQTLALAAWSTSLLIASTVGSVVDALNTYYVK